MTYAEYIAIPSKSARDAAYDKLTPYQCATLMAEAKAELLDARRNVQKTFDDAARDPDVVRLAQKRDITPRQLVEELWGAPDARTTLGQSAPAKLDLTDPALAAFKGLLDG